MSKVIVIKMMYLLLLMNFKMHFLDRRANYYILTKWLNYKRFCCNDFVILLNYFIVLHDAAFIIFTFIC